MNQQGDQEHQEIGNPEYFNIYWDFSEEEPRSHVILTPPSPEAPDGSPNQEQPT